MRALAIPLVGNTAQPKPFPGKIPTRVWWVVAKRFHGEIIGEYIGKPSQNEYQKFLALGRRGDVTYLHYKEFDRAQVVSELVREQPLHPRNGPTPGRSVGRLTTFYRPSGSIGLIGVGPIRTIDVFGYRIYTSLTEPSPDLRESYHRWLYDQGFIGTDQYNRFRNPSIST